jgi:Flp pilus assembly pilin Flp
LFRTQGQTLIDYALLIAVFACVIVFSIPSLRDSTIGVFNQVIARLNNENSNGLPPDGENPGGNENPVFTNWYPPELNTSDNNAIYTSGNITLTGSAKIFGNVVTNGKVITSWASGVDGNILQDANYNFNFPLPIYPDILGSNYANKGSYTAGWWPPPTPITEDGYYSSLKAVNELIVDTGNVGDVRTIVVDDFELSNAGKITLNGGGKLVLVVNDKFKFTNNVSFNTSGLPENVVIYYGGNDTLELGQGHLVGSIYTKQSGVAFAGSTSVSGNVIVGGNSVTVASGNVNLSDALLYAPNSNLQITGSSTIEGKIIANSIEASGASKITFKPVSLDDDFVWNIINQ